MVASSDSTLCSAHVPEISLLRTIEVVKMSAAFYASMAVILCVMVMRVTMPVVNIDVRSVIKRVVIRFDVNRCWPVHSRISNDPSGFDISSGAAAP